MKYFLPAIFWTILTTVLSCLPGKDLQNIQIVSFDKFAHASFYFVFTALVFWGFFKHKILSIKQAIAISFLLAAIYGLFMEWVQGTFFPYRTMDLMDALANAVGALLASVLIFQFKNKFTHK